jgi:hypothetical protein
MYKDALIRLESQTGSKEVLKPALMVKAKKAANRFVKALELEQTAKVKMITVMLFLFHVHLLLHALNSNFRQLI